MSQRLDFADDMCPLQHSVLV